MNATEKKHKVGDPVWVGICLGTVVKISDRSHSLLVEFDSEVRHWIPTEAAYFSMDEAINSPSASHLEWTLPSKSFLHEENKALRAELAALKVENERITTNAFNLSSLIEEVAENVGILSDGMPANDDATERLEIRGDGWSIEGMPGLLVEYVAALKAERAGMVTREVALEAAIHAWSHGRLRFAGGGDPRFKLNPKHLWKEGVAAPNGNEREYREACECAEVVLARAEAEAAKAEQGGPHDNK